ncbi:MAG: patatin-like phospholipase family protein [Burkholderiales bacterium]|nr:patatin-like phospholipase family protein [Burkholderiales bacterium]
MPHSRRHPQIGLALGSGAARGWAHIGIIEALLDAGIEPKIVCGSSMGALVGAAYVAGRLTNLRDWAEAVSWREIIRLMDIRLSGGGVIDGKQIVEFLRNLDISAPIESYPKKFAALATDLVTGREIWLQSGPIDTAVRASISIPGIIRPAEHEGQWLLDGGLVNPVPVSTCRALGAEIIIAVNVNGELLARRFDKKPLKQFDKTTKRIPNEFLTQLHSQMPAAIRQQIDLLAPKLLQPEARTPGYFQVIATVINIMQDHITRTRLAGEPPHVLLVPRMGKIGLLDFNRAKEAIAEGRACVERALPLLQEYI